MEANARNLERIFDQTIQYQIPLFQRPYVWDEARNWAPLWDDIQALLNKQLRKGTVHPHFLGAVVLEQLGNPTGGIYCRQVIDGQQRFTTLQLFLLACRDHATSVGSEKFNERFGDLVSNRRNRIDHDIEVFKVWPTNGDRAAFRLVHEAGSIAALDEQLKSHADLQLSNIVGAYRYFYKQLVAWFSGSFDAAGDEQTVAVLAESERQEALWAVTKASLQVVVIDLDKDDETQVIFETMNALGEPLLPSDLIKNFLFRRATSEGQNVEKLYEKHWQRFDDNWWREPVKQGRLTRYRIDIFLNYYLVLMTSDEVRSTHLFSVFKAFVQDAEPSEGSLIPLPTSAAGHMAQLDRYARVYIKFTTPGDHPRLALFLRRLDAIDTTTVFPFLLFAYGELMPDQQGEFDNILEVIESFLVRRMVCGLTPKNYNRIFIDLIKAVNKALDVSAAFVGQWLASSTGESVRFPDNEEVANALRGMPIYGRLSQPKVRLLLEALDAYAQHNKSEVLALPDGLTIEHVMPQKWRENWPFPESDIADAVDANQNAMDRDVLLNTLGNLTLITSSLNPALSNSAWEIKRPELREFSKLNLTRYFNGPEADTWDDNAIRERTKTLSLGVMKTWPDVERPLPPDA
jgi:hypothetical protein